MDNSIESICQRAGLKGLKETVRVRLEDAIANKLSHEEFLRIALQDEIDFKSNKSLASKIKAAKFEQIKSFADLEMSCYDNNVVQIIRDLRTGRFLDIKQNVIIMGHVGTGKTHLAQAIGLLACEKNKKVRFANTDNLLSQIYMSKADNSHHKLIATYSNFDVLILDDFGIKPFSAEQAYDIYEVISNAHIKSSLVITSNRDTSAWFELFHDKVMASAMMDRVVNSAYILKFEGDSYRKNFRPKVSVNGGEK